MTRQSFLLTTILCTLPLSVSAQVREARPVPNSVIVVFEGQRLPPDALARVQRAGGQVRLAFDSVGVVVAQPASVDGAALIRNLRRDSAVQDADYDVILNLIAPARASADNGAEVTPEAHLAHPLPTFSPALPADFFYTSTPQLWSVKRVGGQGGGIPGGGTGAWDVTKGAGTRIAILDTGVNPAHPDLSPRLILNATFTYEDPGIFGTPNCEVPDGAHPPFDLPIDQNGHGTSMASVAAAAAGPGTGLLIGLAPEAQILNIKVLRNTPATAEFLEGLGVPDTPFNRCLFRNGTGLFSWTLGGILLANQQHADVISMSLGGYVPRNFPGGAGAAIWSAFNRVTNFVTNNGSVVVAAAGNESLDLNRIGPFVVLPADSPHVISVTATTNPGLLPPTPPNRQPCSPGQDCLAFYSNFGSSLHGLAAPGGDLPAGGCAFGGVPCLPTGFIRSACSAGLPGTAPPVAADYPAAGPPRPGTSWGCFSFAGAAQHAWYAQVAGTSPATPLAAAAAALAKSAEPRLSPSQIRTILQRTAQDIGKPGYDELFNFGLVNAAAAVRHATQ